MFWYETTDLVSEFQTMGFLVGRITISNMEYRANVQRSFWLLLVGAYETSHFFKLPEVVTSFSYIINEISTFWGKFS